MGYTWHYIGYTWDYRLHLALGIGTNQTPIFNCVKTANLTVEETSQLTQSCNGSRDLAYNSYNTVGISNSCDKSLHLVFHEPLVDKIIHILHDQRAALDLKRVVSMILAV